MELVRKLTDRVDLERLRADVDRILAVTPLKNDQICLRSRVQSPDPLYEGNGTLWDPKRGSYRIEQAQFTELNREFRGTYLGQVVESFPFPIGRGRLVCLQGRTCHTFHIDLERRFHLALETNPGCVMTYRRGGLFHLPADGHFYEMLTHETHTAMNGSRTPRLHLILDSRETNTQFLERLRSERASEGSELRTEA